MKTARSLSAVSGVFLFSLIGCSAVSNSSEAPSMRHGRAEPEWLTQAVAESQRTMEVRCDAFAPLEIVMTPAPMYSACIGEASAAAIAAREAVYREALANCIAAGPATTAVACCFIRVTDQRAIMAEQQQRCNRECSLATGLPVTRNGERAHCVSVSVSPSRIESNRANTNAVQEVLSACEAAPENATRCQQLPSWLERGYCQNTCAVRAAELAVALDVCVTRALGDGVPISCPIREERRLACEKRCREEVTRRGVSQPGVPPRMEDQ